MTSNQPSSRDDWDSHWSNYAESAGNNPAQAYRRRRILKHLLARRPARVLDIGSGQGDLARDLRRVMPDADIVGIEYSRSGVDIATEKVPGARFFQVDLLHPVDGLDALRGWATDAVCSEVLEHVDDPVTLLRNAATLLAPGASVLITVPAGPMSAFDHHIGHRRHFTPEDLRQVAEGAGFQVAWIERAGFPFFNLYRLAVIMRGDQLVRDAMAEARESHLQRVATTIFSGLFRANLPRSPLGWQLVAEVRAPGGNH